MRAGCIDPFRLQRGDGGRDDLCFLIAELAAFAGMRIDPGDGDSALRELKPPELIIDKADQVDVCGRIQLGEGFPQRHMNRCEHYFESRSKKRHRIFPEPRPTPPSQGSLWVQRHPLVFASTFPLALTAAVLLPICLMLYEVANDTNAISTILILVLLGLFGTVNAVRLWRERRRGRAFVALESAWIALWAISMLAPLAAGK